MILPSLQQLFDTEMDRQEFLTYLGAAILAVIGVNGILQAILQPLQRSHNSSTRSQADSYGGSSYGGEKP
jgi:predicted tellurium resistance membrane protein TerC